MVALATGAERPSSIKPGGIWSNTDYKAPDKRLAREPGVREQIGNPLKTSTKHTLLQKRIKCLDEVLVLIQFMSAPFQDRRAMMTVIRFCPEVD